MTGNRSVIGRARRHLCRAALCAASLIVMAGPVRGDSVPERDDAAPTRALSVHVPALASAGLSGQYEAMAWRPSLTWAASAGVRTSAAGDYRSWTLNVGGEIRYYFTGTAWRSRWRASLIGPFAGIRLDIARTATRDEQEGRALPGQITVAEYAQVGYRFALWGRVEVTPSIGLGVRTDIDQSGFLPAATRGVLTSGLTVGWLW